MNNLITRKTFTGIRIFALLTSLLILLFAVTLQTKADSNVKPKKISRIGKATVTVNAGSELELKVKMSPSYADEDRLKWTIVSGSKYVSFDDDDRTDDEIELKAKKAGTAKIRCTIKGTNKSVTYTVKVKAAQKKITAVGSLTKTVRVGEDFDLEVKKYTGLKDKNLTWTIKKSAIVRFDDDDKKGDEVEFKAKKAGTTKIICTNKLTGQKVKFTVKVVAR